MRPLVELYQTTADRAFSFYEKLVKLGLMKHKTELASDHAELLTRIIMAVIESPLLNLTDAQMELARSLLADALGRAGNRLYPEWLVNLNDLGDIVDAEEVLSIIPCKINP